MTQKASQDAELNGQTLNPISRTQSKRFLSKNSRLSLLWLPKDLGWTHFLTKQEGQGLDTSRGVDAGSPAWLIC